MSLLDLRKIIMRCCHRHHLSIVFFIIDEINFDEMAGKYHRIRVLAVRSDNYCLFFSNSRTYFISVSLPNIEYKLQKIVKRRRKRNRDETRSPLYLFISFPTKLSLLLKLPFHNLALSDHLSQ